MHWTAENAATIEVSGAGCPATVGSAECGSGELAVVPFRSGPLVVVARNETGEDRLTTAPVFVFDIPVTADLPVPLPAPDAPFLDAVAPPDLAAVLPPLPLWPAAPDVRATWASPDHSAAARLRPGPPPPGFGSGTTSCPVDLTSILTGTPPVEIGEETS